MLAVGVKDAGFAVLRIPKDKVDGFQLLELIAKWNPAGLQTEVVFMGGGKGRCRSSRYVAARGLVSAI